MLGQLKRRYSVKGFSSRISARLNPQIAVPTSASTSASVARPTTSNPATSNISVGSSSGAISSSAAGISSTSSSAALKDRAANKIPEIIIPEILNATVQCTDCTTRFSVPEEFADLDEELKFHCPRCNHVFCSKVLRLKKSGGAGDVLNFSAAENFSAQAPSAASNAANHNFEKTAPSELGEFGNSGEFSDSGELADDDHQTTATSSDTKTKQTHSYWHKPARPILTSIREQMALRKELKTQQKNLEEIRATMPVPRANNPIESIESQELADQANQINLPFMFELQTKKPKEITNSNIRKLLSNISAKRFNDLQNNQPESLDKTSVESFTNPELNFDSKQKVILTSLGRCLPLIAPALLVAAGFFILTSAALYSSDLRNGLQKFLYPGAAKVAPIGLYIDNLKADELSLENGEQITLISGKIANHSAKTIKDISLEVLAFNSAGHLAKKTKAQAGNTLTETKLKTLTPEIIARIQNRPGKNSLKPGEEKTFELGLVEQNQADLAFYNTRIYSSRYN